MGSPLYIYDFLWHYLTFSHIVVVGEEAAVVESQGGVSVFAHRRGWGERPSCWGSVVVADRRWRGWWGYWPAQRPYCCAPMPPQHRGAEPGILSLNKDERRVWRGVGRSRRWDWDKNMSLGIHTNWFQDLDATLQERIIWKQGWARSPLRKSAHYSWEIQHTLCSPAAGSRCGQTSSTLSQTHARNIHCSVFPVVGLVPYLLMDIPRATRRRWGGGGERGEGREGWADPLVRVSAVLPLLQWIHTIDAQIQGHLGAVTHSPTQSAPCGSGTPQQILHG